MVMETTKPAAKDASSAETRRRILNAAEVLFVAHGFDGTSMRMLTSQAGVNLASVNYHFGSKEELIRAVFRRRLSELNRARLEALEKVEQDADGAPLRPSRIVDAYFGTALRMAADVQGGGHLFMRLLGRTQTEPHEFVRRFLAEEHGPCVERFLAALYRALPDVPKAEILWRFQFMIGAMSYAIAGPYELQQVAGPFDDDNPERLVGRLMSFLLGGLRAPLGSC